MQLEADILSPCLAGCMDDHEKDKYGVSWGQEIETLKNTIKYSSFHLEGTTYSLKDIVYLLASDGPPYIAKILAMHEIGKTREKYMEVRWFCRPCELPLRAAGVNFKEDCKEIFMMWGLGSKNVVNPASTLGKCNVVCTAPLAWNHPRPSEESIAGANHSFSFAFNAHKLQIVSLSLIVERFGDCYVTGVGVQSDVEKKKSGGSPRKTVNLGIKPAAWVSRSDWPRREPVGRALDDHSEMGKSNGGTPRKAVEPGLVSRVLGSDQRGPQLVGSASDSPMLFSKNNKGDVRMSDLIAEAKRKRPRFGSSGPISESRKLEKHKVIDSSRTGLSEQQKHVSSVYKSCGSPRLGGVEVAESQLKIKGIQDSRGAPTPTVDKSDASRNVGVIQLLEIQLKAKQMQGPREALTFSGPPMEKSNVTPNIRGVELVESQLTHKQLDESEHAVRFPPAHNFFKMPWHKALEIALQKGRSLRLQNLDPGFSSSEIEGMITELLDVSCEARMLPPTDFSSYTSGEALVLFRNQLEAENAYAKFTENVLIWSNDQRPVVVSLACEKKYESSPFHGFLNLAKFNSTYADSQQGQSGATSQCSQPNTVVFEMGMQWRLLQEQHREAWNFAAKIIHSPTIDVFR